MALTILQPNATSSSNLGSGSDVDIVFGTADGSETVRIDADGKVELDVSFNKGGDTIIIGGIAADYKAEVEGSNLVLTNTSGAEIVIPVGTVGATVRFLDAERELVFKSGKVCLGDQVIALTGPAVDVDEGDSNHAPVFTNDEISASIVSGNVLSDSLVGEAVDSDGDALTYSLETAALNGTAVVNANGTYTYTPNAGFTGTDQYVVKVSDGEDTDTVVVRVTVTAGSGGAVGTAQSLKVSSDDLLGTDANDTFRARVVQNNDGAQANALGSGDRIDGDDGTDTLDAWVQDASPLGAGPGSSILPETTSVEVANFRALSVANLISDINVDDIPHLATDVIQDFIPGLDLGVIWGPRVGVEINASDMFGLTEVGSVRSDDSLTIYNLTTLASDGETIRNTEEIKVTMDHTGNDNTIDPESDFTVLFDRDYLLCDVAPPSGAQLFIEMMDLDASRFLDLGFATYPLTTPNGNARSNGGLPIQGQLDDSPYTTIEFDLDGTSIILDISTSDYNTYGELLIAVQAAIAANNTLLSADPNDTVANRLVATLGANFTVNDTDTDPGGSSTGRTLVITDTGGGTISNVFLDASLQGVPGEKDFHLQPYTTPPIPEECKITVEICLDKVGRGGDGGDLTIGGMTPTLANFLDEESQSGIPELPRGVEQFNVTVLGNSVEPSSLAALRSTDNTLQCIYIEDEGSATASLTIGNRNTNYFDGFFLDAEEFGGTLINGVPIVGDMLMLNYCGLSSVKNNAIKDVLVFDASLFDNDTEIHAFFSDEVVEKYLDLEDSDPDATADDQLAAYTFGNGDNILNVNISQTNMAVLGSITRGDFAFMAATNGGDDLIQIQIGDGEGSYGDVQYFAGAQSSQDTLAGTGSYRSIVEDWYHNHVLNDNLAIYAGSGNDKVETWGSSAAYVDLGIGDDVYFSDNSGMDDDDTYFNCGKAVWVFNTQESVENSGNNDEEIDGALYSYEDDHEDLASAQPAQVLGLSKIGLIVTFQTIESATVEVGTSNTNTSATYAITDLTINQAIKKAINTDATLSKLLVAEDGPGRTLVVRSLVDGEMQDVSYDYQTAGPATVTIGDLVIQLVSTGVANAGTQTIGTMTATQIAALARVGFDATGASNKGTDLGPDGNAVVSARFRGEFADESPNGDDMDGEDSYMINNNTVWTDLGNDIVSFSTNGVGDYDGANGGSIETFEIRSLFGDDVVLNFTAAASDPAIAEIQTITVSGNAVSAGQVSFSAGGQNYVVNLDGVAAVDPTSSTEIATAIAAAINAQTGSTGDTAVASGSTVTITYGPSGQNVALATGTVTGTAGTPSNETTVITFTGLAEGAASVAVTFDGVTENVALVPGGTDDPTEIAAAFVAAFTGNPNVTASNTGGVLTLVQTTGTDIADATVAITSGVAITLDADIATSNGAVTAPTVSLAFATVQEGGNPAPGYDIFDATIPLLGVPVFCDNDEQVDNIEQATINGLVQNSAIWVGITDTVDAGDPGAGAGATELARIQNIVTTGDTNAAATGRDLLITVNSDNVGTFYLINNSAGVGNATVSLLGSVELGQYADRDNDGFILDGDKEAIGNWDLMTLANFVPLTPTQITDSFVLA